ncbi:MAG: HlyD family efflux transporter periplasmic adaptor subunit [Muribaculaceae bacterium]|nr:HlyD family efflux transporter periplasmic adaptor subunit [Muribaculaceae bacterium]
MNRHHYIIAMAIMMTACGKAPEFDATGIFEATTVTVSAETSGKILSMDISEGDSITSRQTIAVIDTAMLVLQHRQLESQKLAVEKSSPDIMAQVSSLRAQIGHQKQECDRFGRLLADGAATRKQYADAQAQLKVLQGQLNALMSSLSNSRNSIADNAVALHYQKEQLLEQIARSTVTSPLTGTVLTKYAEPGEFAVPGKPLCKIADLSQIYLRSYFTASQLADLNIGRKVTVIADFGGDRQYEYPGTVTWISQESEFTPKSIQTNDSRANLVYAVKIAVRNDGRLKLGQYGEVRL